jgi:hypothetical protein
MILSMILNHKTFIKSIEGIMKTLKNVLVPGIGSIYRI